MYETAREFFDAARQAALDAERCRLQLRALDETADGIGSPGFEPRVRSTPDPTREQARASAVMDQRARLEARQAEDYRLIDAACEVLYGPDNHGGLWALVGWPADAIWHHYLALETWDEVGRRMHFHPKWVIAQVAVALDVADGLGDFATRIGRGIAEG